MLILGISASPRRGGNCEILLDKALSAAAEAGAETEKVVLSTLTISPCMGCGACDQTGKCILEDDMQDLYEKIDQADVMIFASPIYFYAVSGWAKAAIDRCQALWARKYVLKATGFKSGRKGYFISVGATKGERLFEGARLTMKYFFDAAGYIYVGELLVNGVDSQGDILEHPEYLQAAYRLGQEAVGNRNPEVV